MKFRDKNSTKNLLVLAKMGGPIYRENSVLSRLLPTESTSNIHPRGREHSQIQKNMMGPFQWSFEQPTCSVIKSPKKSSELNQALVEWDRWWGWCVVERQPRNGRRIWRSILIWVIWWRSELIQVAGGGHDLLTEKCWIAQKVRAIFWTIFFIIFPVSAHDRTQNPTVSQRSSMSPHILPVSKNALQSACHRAPQVASLEPELTVFGKPPGSG